MCKLHVTGVLGVTKSSSSSISVREECETEPGVSSPLVSSLQANMPH